MIIIPLGLLLSVPSSAFLGRAPGEGLVWAEGMGSAWKRGLIVVWIH